MMEEKNISGRFVSVYATTTPTHQRQRRLPPVAQPTEPRRYKGRFAYKYGSSEQLEWLKPIILENRLYFPTARQLKDPAEARQDERGAPTLADLAKRYMEPHAGPEEEAGQRRCIDPLGGPPTGRKPRS